MPKIASLLLAPFRFTHNHKWLSFFCLVLFILIGGYVFLQSDRGQRVERGVRTMLSNELIDMGFAIHDITVSGRKRTPPEKLLEALGAKINSNIFSLSLADAHKRIEKLDWVEKASISRRLPDLIHIELVERIPFAMWREGKHFALIDREGNIIIAKKINENDPLIAEYSYLPQIFGKNAPQKITELFILLGDYPSLLQKLRAASLASERRWTLLLQNNVKILLPSKNPDHAMQRLIRLDNDYELLQEEGQEIDLRFPDKIFLTPPQAEIPALRLDRNM